MRGLIAAAMIGLAAAAGAEPSAGPAEDIVVTGARRAPEAVRAESFSFLRRALGEPAAGQYARWNAPLCFGVSGLPADAGRVVVRRLAAAARDAGAPLARGKCEPNVAVIFTDDAKGLVARRMQRTKWMFDEVLPDDRATLKQSDRAVRWWYSTAVEGSDGRVQSHSSAALISNPWGVVSNGRARYLASDNPSVIDTNMRASLSSVSAIIDVKAAEGVRLQALADYVAFIALSKTRMTADYAGASTILRLFDGGPEAPFELTEWDRAYLAALYKAAPNRNAHIQRAQIAAEMTRALSGR